MTAINGEKGALGSRLLVVVVQVFFTLLEGRAPQVKGKRKRFFHVIIGASFYTIIWFQVVNVFFEVVSLKSCASADQPHMFACLSLLVGSKVATRKLPMVCCCHLAKRWHGKAS